MRLFLVLMILPIILVSNNKDSLANSHYKVRFSIQSKYQSSQFEFRNSIGEISEFKTYKKGTYSNYTGKINSLFTFNPELKIDFELPICFKITCGFNYSKIKFNYNSDMINYENYNIYDSTSSPWNPIVIGSYTRSSVIGYSKNESEIGIFGTFIGLGFSKQYRRFNFDADYYFSSNKVVDAFTIRKIYDNGNALQKTESVNFMSDYIHQTGLVFYTHNFSTSISYKFYKNTSVKVGYQYSKNDNDIDDNTYSHYSNFKKVRYHSFIFGLVFNVL